MAGEDGDGTPRWVTVRACYWQGSTLKKGARGRQSVRLHPTGDKSEVVAWAAFLDECSAVFGQRVQSVMLLTGSDANAKSSRPQQLETVSAVLEALNAAAGLGQSPSFAAVLPTKGTVAEAAPESAKADGLSSSLWKAEQRGSVLLGPPSPAAGAGSLRGSASWLLAPSGVGDVSIDIAGGKGASGGAFSTDGDLADSVARLERRLAKAEAAATAERSRGRYVAIAAVVALLVGLALIGVVGWVASVAVSNKSTTTSSSTPAATPTAPSSASSSSSSSPATAVPTTAVPTTAVSAAGASPPTPGPGYVNSQVIIGPSGQVGIDNYGGGAAFNQDAGRGIAGSYVFRNDDLYVGRGLLNGAFSAGTTGVVREYWVACQNRYWDYGSGLTNDAKVYPEGPYQDLNYGVQIEAPFYPRDKTKLGYLKHMYVGYTDYSWSVEVPLPDWAGFMGPILRGVVGDSIHVHYLNNCTIDTTLHPHGVKYNTRVGGSENGDISDEGAWSQWSAAGTRADVTVGENVTYFWDVAVKSGPVGGGNDFSSQCWWYHSHIYEGPEVAKGLLGMIIITAQGWGAADGSGRPKDVDKEFILWLQVVPEANGAAYGAMYAINGKIFGNGPTYTAQQGDRIRWHVMAFGNTQDLHTVHFHQNTVTFRSYRTDIIELLPGSMATADMHADGVGWWYLHCHVESHLTQGMVTSYYVGPAPGTTTAQNWGYSPTLDQASYGPRCCKLPATTIKEFGFTAYSQPPRDI